MTYHKTVDVQCAGVTFRLELDRGQLNIYAIEFNEICRDFRPKELLTVPAYVHHQIVRALLMTGKFPSEPEEQPSSTASPDFDTWWADKDNHKHSTELLYSHIKMRNARGGHLLLEHSKDCYNAGFAANQAYTTELEKWRDEVQRAFSNCRDDSSWEMEKELGDAIKRAPFQSVPSVESVDKKN